MTNLSDPIYTDENAAREHLEALRWPDGPVCPHCGAAEAATKLKGKSTRPGVYKCKACRKPYSVTVGTVFERSKIPLHKWILATHLLSASKKGMSAHQLHRMLGITYKSAWFMAHRIREAMNPSNPTPIGGEGKIIEADETYINTKTKADKRDVYVSGQGWKIERRGERKILSLVERGGQVRSVHVADLTRGTVWNIISRNASRRSRLMTDEAAIYPEIGKQFQGHESVNHSKKEYVRDDAHTNTLEGYFSIFKRGMRGIYQHCGEQHLKRYLVEFDFRYNSKDVSDDERKDIALKGIGGKRLTYHQPNQARH